MENQDMDKIMEMLKTMLATMNANRKIDKEELVERMDKNQVMADKTLKETLAKMEAERKSDRENLKSMMERMMNIDQTDVKLKELTETVETTHRECEEPTSADMKA
jgi:small-conductance mechanosensitive channel